MLRDGFEICLPRPAAEGLRPQIWGECVPPSLIGRILPPYDEFRGAMGLIHGSFIQWSE